MKVKPFRISTSLLCLFIGVSLRLNAQVFTVQHIFTNSPDGGHPRTLALYNGAVFGTTFRGGSSNSGTIFKLNLDGTGYTRLYNFLGDTNGCLLYTSPSPRD